MKILLIDNDDSFTYNLLHLVRSSCSGGDVVDVISKDDVSSADVSRFDRMIISPGAGTPAEAVKIGKIVRTHEGQIPILGICLGHQVIAESYGAATYNLPNPVHGVRSEIFIGDHSGLFRGMDRTIMAGRYHSWCVSSNDLPDCLKVTAVDGEENIMAIAHRDYHIFGVQFHPESFMTKGGAVIMSNFLR